MATPAAFAADVRAFLAAEWDADRYADEVAAATTAGGPPAGRWHRRLFEAGLTAPHWPERFGGRGLPPWSRAVVLDEVDRCGCIGPGNPFGVGWAGSTILHLGSETQRERYLRPAAAGSEVWCQLFSEPGAGSDLAGVSTTAVRDGDRWVVSGQKTWTSGAAAADRGILLVRTDPHAPPHRGLTFLCVDMHAPGVEVRPIRQMTGERHFCDVFLDDVVVADADRVGDVGDGWRVALATLMLERIDLSTGRGVLWGLGPSWRAFERFARSAALDAVRRDRVAALYSTHRVIEWMQQRTLVAAGSGRPPIMETAVMKLLADRFGQEITGLAIDAQGPDGMLRGSGEPWHDAFLFSPALTIGGGTTQVQLSIVGERVLGLAREPDPGRGRSPNR